MDTSKLNLPPRPERPYKSERLFLPDGRPAEKCAKCDGTGHVTHGRDPWMDYPCPARCEDGLVPTTGLNAVVRLLEDALDKPHDHFDHDRWRARVEAAKSLIEDIACDECSRDKTEPEAWR
jgi:hypothetical protein